MKNVLNIVVMIKTSMNVVCYKLMAFKTNYRNVDSCIKQAKILKNLIDKIGRK